MLDIKNNRHIQTEKILTDILENDYSINVLKIQLEHMFLKNRVIHNHLDQIKISKGGVEKVPVYFNYVKNIWTLKNNSVQCLFIDYILMPGVNSSVTEINIDRKISEYIKKIKKGNSLDKYFENVLKDMDNELCFQDYIQTEKFKSLNYVKLTDYFYNLNETGLKKSLIHLCSNPYQFRNVSAGIDTSSFLDNQYAKNHKTYVKNDMLPTNYYNNRIDGIIIDLDNIYDGDILEISKNKFLNKNPFSILFISPDNDNLYKEKILNALKVYLLLIKDDPKDEFTNFIKQIIQKVVLNNFKTLKYDNDIITFNCVYY